MGRIVSELLADALSRRRQPIETPPLEWVSRPMGALVDLSDRDALYAALERDEA
jgi:hypothetical protein